MRDDLGVRLDGLRPWLKAQYRAELGRGDAQARFENDDPKSVADLEKTSPHPTQIRRVLRMLDSPAAVNISHRRIKQYPPTAAVGWLWGFKGGVAVAKDGTTAPAALGVDVYP